MHVTPRPPSNHSSDDRSVWPLATAQPFRVVPPPAATGGDGVTAPADSCVLAGYPPGLATSGRRAFVDLKVGADV